MIPFKIGRVPGKPLNEFNNIPGDRALLEHITVITLPDTRTNCIFAVRENDSRAVVSTLLRPFPFSVVIPYTYSISNHTYAEVLL